MKYILLSTLLLLIDDIICAQTINNGLYVNGSNDFVIVKNDTVQFRYYDIGTLTGTIIGEGILEMKKKGKINIRTSSSLIEKTSLMYCYPRNDDKLSIRFLDNDSLAMVGMNIIISRLQDKRPHIFAFINRDEELFLDKMQIDYLDKKDVLISADFVGYTETKKRTLLERGYDYIIKMRIPNNGIVAKDNKYIIRQLNEGEIIIEYTYSDRKTKKLKKIGYLSDTMITFKKITDDYPLSDFPFDKDVQTLINAASQITL